MPKRERSGAVTKPGARGGADQREAIQLKRMNARARPLPDHQIDAIILHRGIENLLDGGHQAMNFVEKENFARFERSEDGGQVALALEQRAGTGLDGDAQFVGDDLRERRLAQARRAVEQHVIERFAAAARGLDGDLDVFLHARLADVIGQALRANAGVEARVFIEGPRRIRCVVAARLWRITRLAALHGAGFTRRLARSASCRAAQLLQRGAQQRLKTVAGASSFVPAPSSTAFSAARRS